MTFTSKCIAVSALLVLVCIGWLSFLSEVRNEKDREWVTHTLLVVEKLQAVRIDITQAETGQRGYLLTGEETYLVPYEAGLGKLRQDMAELQDLVSDNSNQEEAIQRLQPLIAARLRELGGGIEIRRQSGLLAGVEAVAYGNTQIGAQIGEMRDTEAQLLTRRLKTAAASAGKMKVIVLCGNALAIFILAIKGVVIHHEIGKRNLAEANLKHTNERLESRTSELSETNVELESFAYSVAHDLRAPLRHIAGYSNVLVQDYGPQLDGEAQRYLAKIVDGAQKMGHLVDDLLSLAKVGLEELALEATPLDSMLRQVVKELHAECAGRKIEWQIDKLFVAKCDPGLMKQVFVNLLSNAVKYTSKQEHAVIQIGQTVRDNERAIFVRDNGVGFEMQYADKLFGIFQRLHKAGDFEGTGAGLAIVQRIIQRHAGRIWAEGALDRGATFFFTLGVPQTKPAREPELAIQEKVVNA